MNCPICNTKEIYKHQIVWDYFGPEPVSTETFYLVSFGKYDTPEPGEYECVDGHEFEVDETGEIDNKLLKTA